MSEGKAQQVLKDARAWTVPVPIEQVAKNLGVDVEPAALGGEVSGILVVEDGKAKIGYNRSDSEVRRRFTIAHELAHYLLHAKPSEPGSEVFIDKAYTVYLRSDRSSRGDEKKEIEANKMAAALLMPAGLVRGAAQATAFDLGDEDGLAKLAAQFGVSTQAMSYRLVNLRIARKGRK